MFATSDWEPDVPKGNISFGKKPLKSKNQNKDITSTLQYDDINHDINRAFPIIQSTTKPKKSKNKSNYKKSLVKTLQIQDSVTNKVNESLTNGMKNGSGNLKTDKIKANNMLLSPDSLGNKKKEKKEKRAKAKNVKTECLKAVLKQFSDIKDDEEFRNTKEKSCDETTSSNDQSKRSKGKEVKNKILAFNTPANNDNTVNSVTPEGKIKKNQQKKTKVKRSETKVVVCEVTGNNEGISSPLSNTPGSFVRNPNFNDQQDETKESNGNVSTKKQKKRKRKEKKSTTECENGEDNQIIEISRKRKQESTNEDEKVKSKKTKPPKDVSTLKEAETVNSEEYNDLSAPKVEKGKKGKLKEKLKNILSVAERRPIAKTSNKLRERMMEKLKSAQFRYLNEKLYTSSGMEAQQFFQSDPVAFQTYHEGYQQQVKKWPVNPIDVIAKLIMKMPKTTKIADMGCGEAVLSNRVPHFVRSFDLVATSPNVEACDMAHTPLLTASMDVVVYCLALMGTDLTQYLVEANRVLKMGGLLYIAEVESRFDKPEDFTESVQRLGFKLLKLDKSHEVFFFMQFRKLQEPPTKKSKLPVLSLMPCLYKRR